MRNDKIKKIGIEWDILNKKYDSLIQAMIDNPESMKINSAQMDLLKKMQEELFNLENDLFIELTK